MGDGAMRSAGDADLDGVSRAAVARASRVHARHAARPPHLAHQLEPALQLAVPPSRPPLLPLTQSSRTLSTGTDYMAALHVLALARTPLCVFLSRRGAVQVCEVLNLLSGRAL